MENEKKVFSSVECKNIVCWTRNWLCLIKFVGCFPCDEISVSVNKVKFFFHLLPFVEQKNNK